MRNYSNEVVLWMENCDPLRIVPNTVMLCARNEFLLNNMRDCTPMEFNTIILASGNAGIIRM
jgi:hypothetical protein